MEDDGRQRTTDHDKCSDALKYATTLGGRCHIIAALSHKAKRISHLTSVAERLSAVNSQEVAQLIAMRLAE
eukprot:12889392-Prorocentrum_lima.AAC.1